MSDEHAGQPGNDTDTGTAGPTVGSRALAAGLSQERLDRYVVDGMLLLDGQPVTDLAQSAPSGTRLLVTASS